MNPLRNLLICRLLPVILCIVLITTQVTYSVDDFSSDNDQNRFFSSVKISPESGFIQDIFKGDSSHTVIYIQDSHCNFIAQKNIISIINNLHDTAKKHGINASILAVEGASGRIYAPLLKNIPDTQIRKETALYLLSLGYLNAAEYVYISKNTPIILEGIEDERLFLQNLDAFKTTVRNRETAVLILNTLLDRLYSAEKTFCSPKQQKLLDGIRSYKNGEITLHDWSRFLEATMKDYGLSVHNYPEFEKLQKMFNTETVLKPEEIRLETEKLVKLLSRSLTYEKAQYLLKKVLHYRLNRISAYEYYTYLLNCMKTIIKDTHHSFPAISKYITFLDLQQTIKSSMLFSEITTIAAQLMKQLPKTPEQDNFIKVIDLSELTKDLILLKLSRNAFSDYLRLKKVSNLDHLHKYIKTIPAANLSGNIREISHISKCAEEFYQNALQRDNSLTDNLTKLFSATSKNQIIILITGGFHTDGILKLLKEKEISYIKVLPRITEFNFENMYLDRMMLKKTQFEHFISSLGKYLATPTRLFDSLYYEKMEQGNASDLSLLGQCIAELYAIRQTIPEDITELSEESLPALLKSVKESVSNLKRLWIKQIGYQLSKIPDNEAQRKIYYKEILDSLQNNVFDIDQCQLRRNSIGTTLIIPFVSQTADNPVFLQISPKRLTAQERTSNGFIELIKIDTSDQSMHVVQQRVVPTGDTNSKQQANESKKMRKIFEQTLSEQLSYKKDIKHPEITYSFSEIFINKLHQSGFFLTPEERYLFKYIFEWSRLQAVFRSGIPDPITYAGDIYERFLTLYVTLRKYYPSNTVWIDTLSFDEIESLVPLTLDARKDANRTTKEQILFDEQQDIIILNAFNQLIDKKNESSEPGIIGKSFRFLYKCIQVVFTSVFALLGRRDFRSFVEIFSNKLPERRKRVRSESRFFFENFFVDHIFMRLYEKGFEIIRPERIGFFGPRSDFRGKARYYLAIDHNTNKFVFIKVRKNAAKAISHVLIANPADNPYVAKVIDANKLGPFGEYVVMEYVPGTDLEKWNMNHPNSGFSERLSMAKMLLKGLNHMHYNGFIQGDLHSENVRIMADNSLKLTDFEAPYSRPIETKTDLVHDIYFAGKLLLMLIIPGIQERSAEYLFQNCNEKQIFSEVKKVSGGNIVIARALTIILKQSWASAHDPDNGYSSIYAFLQDIERLDDAANIESLFREFKTSPSMDESIRFAKTAQLLAPDLLTNDSFSSLQNALPKDGPWTLQKYTHQELVKILKDDHSGVFAMNIFETYLQLMFSYKYPENVRKDYIDRFFYYFKDNLAQDPSLFDTLKLIIETFLPRIEQDSFMYFLDKYGNLFAEPLSPEPVNHQQLLNETAIRTKAIDKAA